MAKEGEVISVNISKEKGTVKHTVAEIVIDENGIVDDAHAGLHHRQVSLLSQEDVGKFIERTGMKVSSGQFAENILFCGIDLKTAHILDRIIINEAELELTQIGKKCHGDNCAVYQAVGQCTMPKDGIFCRVIKGGKVKAGDSISHVSRKLKILLITLSDRVALGKSNDLSGPRAKELCEEFLVKRKWDFAIDAVVLSDEKEQLIDELSQAVKTYDVIFTIGSTGVGVRDIAPNVIEQICDKVIPGIMENIRGKFGDKNPLALLSRSVAGIVEQTQIYTLPGSVKATEEYLPEIFKTLEHIIFMMKGLDVHGGALKCVIKKRQSK